MDGKKIIILSLLAMAALLAGLPLIVQAQDEPPQIFVGTARVNGLPVASGMPVTAWQSDRQIAETTTGGGGEFVLQVSGKEGILSFRIGEMTADQRVPWQLGDITKEFILTANDAADPCFTLPRGARALAEVAEPFHEITGKATVNGWPAPPGTPITAWIVLSSPEPAGGGTYNGVHQVAYTVTGAEGSFTLPIVRSLDDVFSSGVTFMIGKLEAAEIYYNYEYSGTVTVGFDLTSKPEAPGLCQGGGSGTEMEELLAGKFIRAFTFDNAAKEWLFYDPAVGDANTLQTFIPGRAYFILVSESVGVSLNGNYQELSHIAGNGWNLIVW